MNNFQIFTDGGAYNKSGGKFRAVSSYRIFKDKVLIHSEEFINEDRTNQFAETYAIAKALENIYKYLDEAKLTETFTVSLYTDSMTSFMTLTQWIYNWIRKHRKGVLYGSTGKPVLNQDAIKAAFYFMQELKKNFNTNVVFYHINSHIAKNKVKELHKEFMKFNKVKIELDELLFLYLQNGKCDEAIKAAHITYMKKPDGSVNT